MTTCFTRRLTVELSITEDVVIYREESLLSQKEYICDEYDHADVINTSMERIPLVYIKSVDELIDIIRVEEEMAGVEPVISKEINDRRKEVVNYVNGLGIRFLDSTPFKFTTVEKFTTFEGDGEYTHSVTPRGIWSEGPTWYHDDIWTFFTYFSWLENNQEKDIVEFLSDNPRIDETCGFINCPEFLNGFQELIDYIRDNIKTLMW